MFISAATLLYSAAESEEVPATKLEAAAVGVFDVPPEWATTPVEYVCTALILSFCAIADVIIDATAAAF